LHASDTLIEKTHASAFHGTGLADLLAEQGIDSLVVTGLTTSGCVRASAVDGLQHNFKVVIVEEATGDRDLAAHNANLYDLNAKYVDVLPLEETLQLL
jgi:nicotinamidase-related amidase